MKHLRITSSFLLLIYVTPAFAGDNCQVFLETLKDKSLSVRVYPGHGLNLSFLDTDEIVKKAWLDDPSRITLSFDGNLCQPMAAQCTEGGAQVIHLRQIVAINFPQLPRHPSGSTLLTIITENANGRSLYQFKVTPTTGNPRCTTYTFNSLPVTVANNSQSTDPPLEVVNTQPFKTTPISPSIIQANDLVYGLLVAQGKGQKQLAFGSPTYLKVQSAIRWLRRGRSLAQAARLSQLSLPMLEQLIQYGQVRPASPAKTVL